MDDKYQKKINKELDRIIAATVNIHEQFSLLRSIAERAGDAEGIRKVLAMAIGDEHCYVLGSEEVSRWLLTGEVK